MFYKHKNGISFRKLEKYDLLDLKNLKDESWFGTVHTACVIMADQEKRFESISNNKSCLYFIIMIDTIMYGQPCAIPIGLYGITDIENIDRSCSFTHSIYAEFRGKGHGTKSLQAAVDMTFEVFGMRRIDTWILENNHAEQKVAAKSGFIEEGKKRKAVYKCGEYLDCILFGLLRDEWESDHRVKQLGICNTSYQPKMKP